MSKDYDFIDSLLQEIESCKGSYYEVSVNEEFIQDMKYIFQDIFILRLIMNHKLLNYVLKNSKCAFMYHLNDAEINLLKSFKERWKKDEAERLP